MCGIWALFGLPNPNCYFAEFRKISHRGPDAWRMEADARMKNACVGFHRLSIVDQDNGMQPMRIAKRPNVTLLCNGEIYNCRTLAEEHGLVYQTGCDVECIIHLYSKYGFEKAIQMLDGVYAICMIDIDAKKVFLARDPYGVRPLFRFHSFSEKVLAISSEAKGIVSIAKELSESKLLYQFPPGHCEEYSYNDEGFVTFVKKTSHFTMDDSVKFWKLVPHTFDIKDPRHGIVTLLTEACRKRLMSDRRIGCLLSGGLDSSLVAALVVKLAKEAKLPYKIQTFAIGMKGSPDLAAARKVADHIGSEHHEVIFTEESVEECLDKVIYHLESFDITTIRASIGLYLVCKYIQEKTNTTVLFSGEGADELCQGYIYFKDAPDATAADIESRRLLTDIHLYDGLRTDRITSAFSLEVRCPFLDIDFTRHILSLNEKMRQPIDGVEKHLLRSAFSGGKLLPDSILWRPKEAFSDGVADEKRSLFTVIQDMVMKWVQEEEVITVGPRYAHCRPMTKESYHFRKTFDQWFGPFDHLIPYYWMPKWNTNVTDPSARYIQHYNAASKENSKEEVSK